MTVSTSIIVAKSHADEKNQLPLLGSNSTPEVWEEGMLLFSRVLSLQCYHLKVVIKM